MKMKYVMALLVAVVLPAAYFLWPRTEDAPNQDSWVSPAVDKRAQTPRRPRKSLRNRKSDSQVLSVKADKRLPVIEELAEEETLDSEMRDILQSIRDALNAADFKLLRNALEKMKEAGAATGSGDAASWAAHVPKGIRCAAVEAAGYFGAEALPELLDYIVDIDSEVAQDALSQLELAIQDLSLGDRERAEVFKSLSSVLTDADALDWMLSSATDARHSVGVDTFVHIAQNGTPEAKKMVSEYIELFTGGEATTASEAQDWLRENPDDPDDEEFYGPLTD